MQIFVLFILFTGILASDQNCEITQLRVCDVFNGTVVSNCTPHNVTYCVFDRELLDKVISGEVPWWLVAIAASCLILGFVIALAFKHCRPKEHVIELEDSN